MSTLILDYLGNLKWKTYANNVSSTSLGGKHAQDTGTTADVKDELVLEEMGIVHDRIAVRSRADSVLEHLLMDS